MTKKIMTSSWALTQRKKMSDAWDIRKFSYPDDPLGGWESSYIINGAHRECGPEYEAIPIGNPYGFMMCVKRRGVGGKSLDTNQFEIDPSVFNGYHRYSADMYRPWRETAIQISDPYDYYDRVIPNESYLQTEDYIAREVKFNGTGVTPIHTPGAPTHHGFREYGYSFTPYAPYKYDITHLHQRFPLWKGLKGFHGAEEKALDKFGKNFHLRRV